MGAITNIAWTHHTHNAWIGCTQVSPGCLNCYPKTDCEVRGIFRVQWNSGERVRVSDSKLCEPFAWDRAAAKARVRRRVFASSMCDVFDQHESIKPEWKLALWATIRETAHLDWLVLTKRPECVQGDIDAFAGGVLPANVWLGFSAESQQLFDHRWHFVRELSATVKFVSYEPALGPIRLTDDHRELGWVIFGGETSLQRAVARKADLQWARDIRGDCSALGIPFFFKQTGSWIDGVWRAKVSRVFKERHDKLDGRVIHEWPDS